MSKTVHVSTAILIRQQLNTKCKQTINEYIYMYIHHRTKQTQLVDVLTGAGPLIDEGTSFNIP